MKNIIWVMVMFYSGLIYAGEFEAGISEFHQGNYQQANLHFYECKDTNIFCIHNLGATNLKLENLAEAKAWFTLASRYGYIKSMIALKQNNWPIPKADLAYKLTKNKSGDERYKSSMGNEYEYDLSKPSDQMRYETDLGAQMRDEVDIDPRRDIERDLGEYGGGKVKRNY